LAKAAAKAADNEQKDKMARQVRERLASAAVKKKQSVRQWKNLTVLYNPS